MIRRARSNRNKVQVTHHRDGRFELNGECYVGRQTPSAGR